MYRIFFFIVEVAIFVESMQDANKKVINWPWMFQNKNLYAYARSNLLKPEEFNNIANSKRDNVPDTQLFERDTRNTITEYVNLCDTITRKVEFEDKEYEYQPPFYHEVLCKNVANHDRKEKSDNPAMQKCVHPNFHCIQRSRTLLMARRKWDDECWEPFTKVIASSCDCMWPTTILGDVSIYY